LVRSPLVAIIDDDEALRSSLVDLMHSTGYRVEPFASTETFLASPNLFDFEGVIADVHLPGMSGLDLVRKLRVQGDMTPVFLITALTDRRLDDEATLAGAQCLLRKPFEARALLDCVSLHDERPRC
jgi:FixJ family two-component response regulator